MNSLARRSLLRLGGVAAIGSVASLTLPVRADASSRIGFRTRCGINANTPYEADRRVDTFGGVGMARAFYSGMMPATWNPAVEGASPQHAVQVSFKADPTAVARGVYDTTLLSWMASIPSGWVVYLTFWHEPNDELRAGQFSASDFRAAWSHLSTLRRQQAQLRPDVRLRLVPVFMAYLVDVPGGWSDSWVPRPDEVAFVSWDIYGNPTGGNGLDGAYPPVSASIDPCLRVSSRLGFRRWGVTEFNTPQRSWDVNEQARKQWLEEFRRYALGGRTTATQLGVPKILLLWEGDGTNWDQRFATNTTRDWWSSVITTDLAS